MDAVTKIFPVNSVRICVNETAGELKGVLCGVAMQENIEFCGTRELIVKIDKYFDDIGQPQPHQVIRSFRKTERDYKPYNAKPERFHASEEISKQLGDKTTVDVVIFSRHHAEWQGVIKDLDDKVVCKFKSTLEFLSWFEKM